MFCNTGNWKCKYKCRFTPIEVNKLFFIFFVMMRDINNNENNAIVSQNKGMSYLEDTIYTIHISYDA